MEKAPNSLSLELQAMAAVGQVLGDLTDPAARQRVLKWAAERFAIEGVMAPNLLDAESPAAAVIGGDPALAVDSLDEMFTTPALAVDSVDETFAIPALAVDSLDEMFAVDAVETDDDLGEFAAPRTVACVPDAAKLPLEAVIRSLAVDFQRFADEWNGATA